MKRFSFILIAAAAIAASVQLVSCSRNDDKSPVTDDTCPVTVTKTRFDGTFTYNLSSVSGSWISTSGGEFPVYFWENVGPSPAGYPDVYGDGYTDMVLTTGIPARMQVVTTNDEAAPIEIETIDSKSAKVRFLKDGCGHGAGYIAVVAENGVSKLVTVGVYKSVPANTGNYPSMMEYADGDSSAVSVSAVLLNRKDASETAVSVPFGKTISVGGITHGFIPNYDVHNTVGEVEFASAKGQVSGTALPACLKDFKGITISPADTGMIFVPVKCRRPDGSYGNDETQYLAFHVVEAR